MTCEAHCLDVGLQERRAIGARGLETGGSTSVDEGGLCNAETSGWTVCPMPAPPTETKAASAAVERRSNAGAIYLTVVGGRSGDPGRTKERRPRA